MKRAYLSLAILAGIPGGPSVAQGMQGAQPGQMSIEPYPSLPKSGIVQFTLPDGIVLLDYRDGRIGMVVPSGEESTSYAPATVSAGSGVYCSYTPGESTYRQPYDSSGSAVREAPLDSTAMQVLAEQIKKETDGLNPAELGYGASRPVSASLDKAVKGAAESGCNSAQSPLTPSPAP
jgi:hypothetical protein